MDEQQEAEYQRMQMWSTRPTTPKTAFYAGGEETAYGRRRRRMQEDWDKRYATMMEEERLARETEVEQRRLGLQERDQFIQEQEYNRKLKEYEAQQDIKGQAEIESNNILDWLSGRAVDETGQRIQKPDPKTSEFQTELIRRLAENPLGAELNKGIVDQYISANKTYLDAQQARQEEASELSKAETRAKVSLAKELATVGKSIAEFTDENGRIDFEKANVALGEAIRTGKEQEAIRGEEREQKRNINSQISKLETDLTKIRGEVGRYEKLLETRKSSETQKQLDGALVEQGILEDEINRLNRLRGGEAAEQQPQAQQPQKELSQRDQAALNWANANPDDPRSQKIKDKLGVQ